MKKQSDRGNTTESTVQKPFTQVKTHKGINSRENHCGLRKLVEGHNTIIIHGFAGSFTKSLIAMFIHPRV